MEVKWIKLEDYDKYEVSNTGHVRNASTLRILKGSLTADGYMQINLSSEGKSHSCTVHRLVAKAFLPDWDPKLEVNHIDGNKLNNNVENLEMVTHLENMQHFWTSEAFESARKSYRELKRDTMNKRWRDPQFRDKVQSIMNSKECRDSKSKALKELWNTPEMLEFARERNKIMWSDPEKHDKHVQAIKNGWSDPEKREAVSDRMSRYIWMTPPQGKSIRVDKDNVGEFLSKGYTKGRRPLSRKRQIYCKETNTTYISMNECDKHLGWKPGTTFQIVHDSLPNKLKHLKNMYHISVVEVDS